MIKKKEFDMPYIGIDPNPDYDILYGKYGEFSIILKIRNPVLTYSGSSNEYTEAHSMFQNIIKVLGENIFLQKMDVISRTQYVYEPAEEFLQNEYNRHFEGRNYLKVETYITITRQVKRKAFYTYNKKALTDFKQSAGKVVDILDRSGCGPVVLREKEIYALVKRTVNADFHSPVITMDNMIPSNHDIKIGERLVKCISLIDIDAVDLPAKLPTNVELNDNSSLIGFPVDLFSFLLKVPNFDTIIYNQVIEVPGQMVTLNKLGLKKKRHSGISDPANNLAGEDIDLLLKDVAKDNQLLVNCHFNIVISTDKENMQKASNYVETSLFQHGITVSKHSYNQLQLFRSVLPGNSTEIEHYDLFLTTVDAALCLFFKEALTVDEVSDFKIRFTDRQGVPICIDPADLPMEQNRIDNRNKFVLGPSGSGKSFFMNGLLEQYMLYNMDVVIVDTGHSYSGLCSYYNGKYITYSEKAPITMNPFAAMEDELNVEKKDFLNTLICLLWKGAEGKVEQAEHDVIAQTLSAYYLNYFAGDDLIDLPEEEKDVCREHAKELAAEIDYHNPENPTKNLLDIKEIENETNKILLNFEGSDEEKKSRYNEEYKRVYDKKLEAKIAERRNAAAHDIYLNLYHEARLTAQKELVKNRITELNFDSFYRFCLYKIPKIKEKNPISFDFDEFRFVLKKFYKGGSYDTILNEAAEQSMFTERFIVFEIDSIKGAHVKAA